MNKISLELGSSISYEKKIYKIEKYISSKEILVKQNEYPFETKVIKITDIVALKQEAKIFEKDLSRDKDWDEALKRFKIIEPLLSNKINTRNEVGRIAKANNKSIATIYRWMDAYNQTGTKNSLMPEYKKRGGIKQSRFSNEQEAIIESLVNELYLNQQKYSINYIYKELLEKFEKAKLKPPHINTLRDRIKKLPIKIVTQKRHKEKVSDTRGMPSKNKRGRFPLEHVQIDHTPLDLILVNEDDREPIGRAFLTLAIDVYSRMVMGFYISYEAVSFFNTGQCILNMIMPKDSFLKEVGVEGEWEIYGLPREISLDNAKEFRSMDITRFCEQYNIQIDWRPVGRSNYGGTVERIFRTLGDSVHNLSGATFSSIVAKGTYDSNKNAVMSISEFETWFTHLIVNEYHKNIHSEIGMTPEEKYMQGIFGIGGVVGVGLPPIIENTKALRYSLLPSVKRSVQKTGITIDYITYYSDVLRKWIVPQRSKNKDKSTQFICKRDPRDISKIFFYDPEIKKYFEIPYRNRTNPQIDLQELRETIKTIKEHKGSDTLIDESKVFQTHKKMKEIEDNAKIKTKKAKRKKSSQKYLNKKLEVENKVFEKESKDENLNNRKENKVSSFEKPQLFDFDINEDF